MALTWTFVFTVFLIYLGYILATNMETMTEWLQGLYIVVLAAGFSTVMFLFREHFKNKYEEKVQRKDREFTISKPKP